MPMITTTAAEEQLAFLPARLPDPQDQQRPGALDTIGAAFSQANTLGSALAYGFDAPTPYAPDFDPFDGLEEPYQPFARAFIDANSPADVERIKRRIDAEQQDRRTLAAAGPAGIAAGFVAGALDPVNLLPLGAAARAARGASLASRVAIGTAGATVGAAAQEAGLQLTQDTRSMGESAANVGTAAVFGGAVGAALGQGSRAVNAARAGAAGAAVGGGAAAASAAMSPQELDAEALLGIGVSAFMAGILGGAVGAAHGAWPELRAQVARDITGPARATTDPGAIPAADTGRTATTPDPLTPGSIRLTAAELEADTGPRATGPADGVSSVGAAEVGANAAADRLTGAFGIERATAFQSPLLRLATSPSVESRRALAELAEQPFTYERNALGMASPVAVETRVKQWDAPLAQALEEVDRIFLRYRTGSDGGSMLATRAADLTGAARRAGRMTVQEFREAVGQAMRRGDQHPIPEVAEAAQAMRRAVFEPLKERAVELGLLPDDVSTDTAASYLTRVWSVERIKARRPEFVQRSTAWLSEQRDGAADRLTELDERATTFRAQAEKERQQTQETAAELGKVKAELARVRAARTAAGNEARRAQTASRRAEAGTDDFAAFMRDVRRGRPAGKAPPRLTAWLVSKGGVIDQGGEVRALGIDHKTRPGLINNKRGMPLDEAARAAWEEGYIGDRDERPDVQEFLDALQSDVRDLSPIYRADDSEWFLYAEEITRYREELDRAGLDIDRLSDAELQARIAADREGPITDAEARAAEIGAAITTDRVTRSREALDAARQRLEGIRGDVAKLRSRRDELELWLANRTAALRDSEEGLKKAERAISETAAFARADDMELEDIAQQITDRILGHPDGRIPYEVVPLTRGPLRERSFGIPDAVVEDFLESDVERVARIYTRTMAADVELAARFGRADMRDQIARIGDAYTAATRRTTDERALKRLDQQRRADVRDLEAIRDRIRGTYRAPADPDSLFARAVPVVANFNYLRLLGGMTISSIPDLARIVSVRGFTGMFRHALVPLATNARKYRLAAAEAKKAGTALDMVLHSRAASLADVMDAYAPRSRFERGLQAAANNFGVVTLMAPWTAAMKQLAGTVAAAGMLEDAAAWSAGRASRKAITRLASAGINEETAGRIARQFEQHGQQEGGLYLPNTDAWTDRGALEAFRGALVREVDRTIVTPTAGTRPLWMSEPWGKLIGQFQSFGVASAQQVLIAGLQRSDTAFVNAVAFGVGLGMLTYAVKSWIAGREPSDDPREWVTKGLEFSGVTGWLMEPLKIGDRLTGGALGLSGKAPTGRYRGDTPVEIIGGPTAGLVNDALGGGVRTLMGDPSRGDLSAVRRLLPYQNLWALRNVFDQAEAGAAEAMGLPARR